MYGGRVGFFTLQFPTPQGHHALAVVRAYQRMFNRTPTWAELYYYTNLIRSRPSSMAWYRQLSASQDGQINYTSGRFGSYGGNSTGGTGSGSGGPVIAGASCGTRASRPPPRHWPTGPDPGWVAR